MKLKRIEHIIKNFWISNNWISIRYFYNKFYFCIIWIFLSIKIITCSWYCKRSCKAWARGATKFAAIRGSSIFNIIIIPFMRNFKFAYYSDFISSSIFVMAFNKKSITYLYRKFIGIKKKPVTSSLFIPFINLKSLQYL